MSRLALTGGVLAALLPALAYAQDAAPQVEELVVTGEKATRSLQDTVASVALIGAQRIEAENIQSLTDIVNRTANVAETRGGEGFTIRGISNSNVSGGGSSALASVYVDGAAIPERGMISGVLDMWDVRQVEILRGPQSTLQGRNALAGAVVINTQDPSWDWQARGRVLLSDRQEQSYALAIGGPIVADQLAFRLSVQDRDADGFIYNTTRKTDEDPVRATTFRGKLLFTPSTTPGLTVRASVIHDEREGGFVYSYARTDRPDAFENRVATGDFPNDNDVTTNLISLSADYALSDRLKLSSVSAWNKVKSRGRYDVDGGPTDLAHAVEDEIISTATQEFRLNYDGDRLSGLAGLYFSRRERDDRIASLSNVATPRTTLIGVLMSPPFGLPAANAAAVASAYVAALPSVAIDFRGDAPEEVTTAAIFADGRFRLTDKATILAGFRYDREESSLAVRQSTRFAGTYPNPASFGALAPVIAGLNQVVALYVSQAGASQPEVSRDFDAFLPKLGVKYDFTDDASLSFVAQRGYRSGGASLNIARAQVVAYDPEYTWNYELALRTAWLDKALTVNANAYYVDWSDQQVQVNLGSSIYDTQTENAGASHLYGAEVEAAWRPSAKWGLYGSAGYSRTKFDDFTVTAGSLTADLSGSEFAFAPRWTWAVGGDYRWDNGLFANLNANYRSSAYGVTGVDQAASRIDARTVVNAKLGYQVDHWTISAFGNNLFDEAYVQYVQPSASRAMFGAPRVVGVILEANW
jgi:outer membrane receptor protein involved in Fe transport